MSEEQNNEGFDSTRDRAEESGNTFEQQARSSAKEFRESWNETTKNTGDNKKVLAGILAIFLGGLGIHKFILGYNTEGIILLSITVLSFPLMCIIIGAFTIYIPIVIGIIEGIIYLTKSDEEFYETYQVGRHPWF